MPKRGRGAAGQPGLRGRRSSRFSANRQGAANPMPILLPVLSGRHSKSDSNSVRAFDSDIRCTEAERRGDLCAERGALTGLRGASSSAREQRAAGCRVGSAPHSPGLQRGATGSHPVLPGPSVDAHAHLARLNILKLRCRVVPENQECRLQPEWKGAVQNVQAFRGPWGLVVLTWGT